MGYRYTKGRRSLTNHSIDMLSADAMKKALDLAVPRDHAKRRLVYTTLTIR